MIFPGEIKSAHDILNCRIRFDSEWAEIIVLDGVWEPYSTPTYKKLYQDPANLANAAQGKYLGVADKVFGNIYLNLCFPTGSLKVDAALLQDLKNKKWRPAKNKGEIAKYCGFSKKLEKINFVIIVDDESKKKE